MPQNQLFLGRKRSPEDPRDLRAARYIADVPDPPARLSLGGGPGTRWSMFLNNSIGDCTVAAQAHMIQVWTETTKSHRAPITNLAVLKRYEAISGYVLGDATTDTGCDERSVLKYWLANPLLGHGITAFAAIEPLESQHSITAMRNIKQAMWVFGGLYLGLDLPLSAQDQIERGEVWDVTSGRDAAVGSWGGHAVNAVGYSVDGVDCITWGRRQLMTWRFVTAYCSELWAVISPDWLKSGRSPSGFDLDTLNADLAAVRAA